MNKKIITIFGTIPIFVIYTTNGKSKKAKLNAKADKANAKLNAKQAKLNAKLNKLNGGN